MKGISIDNQRFRNLLLAWPEKAIKFLYDSYYNSLIHISQRYTSDRKISEDIVQQTLARVWQHHKVLSKAQDQSIEYYLVKVVKRKSIIAMGKIIEKERHEKSRTDR